MSLSLYSKNKFINHALKGVNMGTAPTTVYISFHSADPADTGANEVTTTYLAQRAAYTSSNFTAPSTVATNRTFSNSTQIALGTSIAASSGIPYFGVWDAVSGGNFLWGGRYETSLGVANPFVFGSGDVLIVPVNSLILSLGITDWSVYIRDQQLNWLRGTAAAAAPTTAYAGLFTALNTSGTGTEVTTTIRVAGRVAIASTAWDAITDNGIARNTQNTNNIDFGSSAGAVTGLAFLGLFDAASSGNLIALAATSSTLNIAIADPVLIGAGYLKLQQS